MSALPPLCGDTEFRMNAVPITISCLRRDAQHLAGLSVCVR